MVVPHKRWGVFTEHGIGHRAALLVGWQMAALGFGERVHFLGHPGEETGRQNMIQCS